MNGILTTEDMLGPGARALPNDRGVDISAVEGNFKVRAARGFAEKFVAQIEEHADG